jgi:hypothetical protein
VGLATPPWRRAVVKCSGLPVAWSTPSLTSVCTMSSISAASIWWNLRGRGHRSGQERAFLSIDNLHARGDESLKYSTQAEPRLDLYMSSSA